MKNGVAKRVGRIISGSVHAVIDAIENMAPESAMEQAIREVEQALDDVRQELGRSIAQRHLASQRLAKQNEEHESLQEKISHALNEGRQDLAEAAVGRQLDIEAQIPVLEQSISEASEQEKEWEGYIAALQAKRREMESELLSFRKERLQAAHIEAGAVADVASGSAQARVDEACSAFDRILTRQTGLQRGQGPDRAMATKLAQLETLSRQNRIQERLTLIKQGVARC